MATVETDPPRRVRVAADGDRVTFLRAGGLWVHDVGHGQRRVAGPGITGYATDRLAHCAAFPLAGKLHRADLTTGAVTTVPTAGPAEDPRPDPTGARIGYLTGGSLRVSEPGGDDVLLAGEPERDGRPYWGRPDPAGWRFGRDRGWWWSADGGSVLATRVERGRVSLHLLHLDGGWVDVHWDRETYPYLVGVCWTGVGDPLVAVLRRPQRHGLVLAVDARTGETQVHAELADPRWVEPVPGTPRHLADGRVLVGGELAHDGYDARCLFADGTLLTPPSLYVRRVVGQFPDPTELLVEGSAGEPSEQHLFRVSTTAGAGGADARPITTTPGWHRGVVGGDTLVIGSESLDHPGLRWTVYRGGDSARVADLAAPAAARVPAPQPQLARVTDRRLPTGVLYPRSHVAGRRLPVVVDAGSVDQHAGGLRQGVRAVRSDWTARQDLADTGVAVVAIDHRGTPGVAPSFEKVVHRRLADLALADLADALAALAGKQPDLDLDRVAIRGRGVGGWLAVLAVLRHPQRFRCAVAEAPVVDWSRTDPAFAERYLGLTDEPEVYQHHSLLAAAAPSGPRGRPLLLLSPAPELEAALAAAGHPYTVAPDREPEFLRRHL